MHVLHVYVCTYIYISLVTKHEGLVQSFYVNRRYSWSVCASLSATDFQSISDCFSLVPLTAWSWNWVAIIKRYIHIYVHNSLTPYIVITIRRFDCIRVTDLLRMLLQDDFKLTSLPVVASSQLEWGGWREGVCPYYFIVETSSLTWHCPAHAVMEASCMQIL